MKDLGVEKYYCTSCATDTSKIEWTYFAPEVMNDCCFTRFELTTLALNKCSKALKWAECK